MPDGHDKAADRTIDPLAPGALTDTVSRLMSAQANSSLIKSTPAIAVISWILPGAGHFIVGERARGMVVGITILVLYFSGLLVGGVRALEVPGYNAHGAKLMAQNGTDGRLHISPEREDPAGDQIWVMQSRGWFEEVKGKPWSVVQIMAGPVDIICSVWSLRVSPGGEPTPEQMEHFASRSHSHNNELGVLYMAVAGLLNLLAIIDASSRSAAGGASR